MPKGPKGMIKRARYLFREIELPPNAKRELVLHKFFNGLTLNLLTMADRNFLASEFRNLEEKKCTPREFRQRLLANTFMMALSNSELNSLMQVKLSFLGEQIKAIRARKKIRLSSLEKSIMQRVRKAPNYQTKQQDKQRLKIAFDELAKAESIFFNSRQKLPSSELRVLRDRMIHCEETVMQIIQNVF